VKLEDARDDYGNQRLLNLDPVTGNVAIKSILPVVLVTYIPKRHAADAAECDRGAPSKHENARI